MVARFSRVVLSLLLFCCPLSPVCAQFGAGPTLSGLLPKHVTLVSKLPAVFNATGKSVSLRMRDPNGQLQESLDARILREFTENDSTLRVSDTNPDYVVSCEVLQWVDPKYIDMNSPTGSTKVLTGTLSVRFEIDEMRSRTVKRSGVAKQDVQQTVSQTTKASGPAVLFGRKIGGSSAGGTNDFKAMSQAGAQQLLVEDVARQISNYLVPISQTLDVPLATGGPLSDADKFAQGALWPRYLETLETMSPYPDARADAYRQYDIGVANEALAYGAESNAAAVKYLEQSSNAYGKAIDAKPEEKRFIPAQTRIKLALKHYEELRDMSSHAAGTVPAAATPAAEKPLTNADIIDMVGAKLDQANIVDTIQHSIATEFDLTPRGLIALSKAGVNGQVIQAMKQQQRGGVPGRR